jgi:hypothetical protein
VPGLVNVCVYVAPGLSVWLWKAPLVDVTLCGMLSWLVHVTTPPTATVTEPGEKALFARETLALAGAGAPGSPGPGFGVPPPPLPARTVIVPCWPGSSLCSSST